MKIHEQFAIFIEPPGNIQKEIHTLRLASAAITQNAEILSFPDLIPVCVVSEAVPYEKIFYYEKLFRGHVCIQNTIADDSGYLFLPVLIGNTTAETFIIQEQLPAAWKLCNISVGKANSLESMQKALQSSGPLCFSSGRILVTKLSFLDKSGTSFALQIIRSVHRKKP